MLRVLHFVLYLGLSDGGLAGILTLFIGRSEFFKTLLLFNTLNQLCKIDVIVRSITILELTVIIQHLELLLVIREPLLVLNAVTESLSVHNVLQVVGYQ